MTPDDPRSVGWVRTGKTWVFGDEVSIEYISPLRYMFDPTGRAEACLKFLDPVFAAAEKTGDLLVAGSLFGHGPGHDHGVLALREAGIAGVVATSFAPQFFRHAIGHGLLVAECPQILDLVSAGDRVEMDFATGIGMNLTTGAGIRADVPAGPARDIIAVGGLVPYLRAHLLTNPSTHT
ncbi:MAG: 3-isopropylmalate/(R)-2-methylmalate dehydratase small subunit [Subtercola sp.]|nr:3-isopropylmalate/(R)-2-methylmalate dehydratase small subunit [Subtercola sp.]